MRTGSLFTALLLLAAAAPAARADSAADDPDSGADMIGRPAPRWTFDRWARGGPLTLQDLRGRVVLVRWFTEGCHFCQATLPVLEDLEHRYGGDGLVVVGVFHPKPLPHEVADERIVKLANDLGYSGPVAVDGHWRTLDRYWLDGHPDRNWTSVSFLVDRAGNVRWVHGGGEYHPSTDPRHHRCELQYEGLEKVLAEVLAEPAPPRP